MRFSKALDAVQVGKRAQRKGWNGKGMFIFNVPGSKFKVSREPLLGILGEGTDVEYNSHIDMVTADGSISVWTPSQSDMAAEDWELI